MISYDIADILARCIILFLAITVHEFSHGMAAYKLGDPTAKYEGRLTLNPLSHMDPIGAVCMVLFRFGWAKPVPINPMYFRDRKRDTAITAAAGPLSNILMAFAAALLLAPFIVFVKPDFNNVITYFIEKLLYECAYLNISFAAFNLIPLLFLLQPRLFPLLFLFSISLPAYLSALLYNRLFKTIEEKIEEKNGGEKAAEAEEDEEEKIFHDHLDEDIIAKENK